VPKSVQKASLTQQQHHGPTLRVSADQGHETMQGMSSPETRITSLDLQSRTIVTNGCWYRWPVVPSYRHADSHRIFRNEIGSASH